LSSAEALREGSLKDEVIRLSPWYFDMEVAGGLRTSAYLDTQPQPGFARVTVDFFPPEGALERRQAFVPEDNVPTADVAVPFINPRNSFLHTLGSLYPNGLEGRSVLDCACNCGAYLFWAKEMGAGRCFGFDLREHWITQARFLMEHREGPTDGMRFELSNVYDLPKLELEPFDVVLFNGILYHLPDPISGLRIAADLAKEMLVIDTAARKGMPDGMLVSGEQPPHMAGGIYGVRWLPTGPRVLSRLVNWMGYEESRCSWWRSAYGGPVRDRIELVAAREQGQLDNFDAAMGEGAQRVCSIVSRNVAPNTVALVLSQGDERLLDLEERTGWHFPRGEDGRWSAAKLDGRGAVQHLEKLRADGADYLVVPAGSAPWVQARAQLQRHLARCPCVLRGRDCAIFALNRARAEAGEMMHDSARDRSHGLQRR
jgi:SAM-dependent methyltransferase